jgi:hypothetical protein
MIGDGDEAPCGGEGRSHVRARGVEDGRIPAAGQVLRAVPGRSAQSSTAACSWSGRETRASAWAPVKRASWRARPPTAPAAPTTSMRSPGAQLRGPQVLLGGRPGQWKGCRVRQRHSGRYGSERMAGQDEAPGCCGRWRSAARLACRPARSGTTARTPRLRG